MSLRAKAVAVLCVLAAGLLLIMPNAAAVTYSVNTNPYSANHVVSAMGVMDAYELSAATGAEVTYSASATEGGCIIVEFGPNPWPTLAMVTWAMYSSQGCVSSYSNTFPVNSSVGTDFIMYVETTQTTDVAYSVTISVQTPGVQTPVWIPILLALIVVTALVVVAWLVRARRKPAHMSPTSSMPPPPRQPPEQPPSPPGTPP